jgi:hypothetical protein
MKLALIHPPEPMLSIATEVCQHPITSRRWRPSYVIV